MQRLEKLSSLFKVLLALPITEAATFINARLPQIDAAVYTQVVYNLQCINEQYNNRMISLILDALKDTSLTNKTVCMPRGFCDYDAIGSYGSSFFGNAICGLRAYFSSNGTYLQFRDIIKPFLNSRNQTLAQSIYLQDNQVMDRLLAMSVNASREWNEGDTAIAAGVGILLLLILLMSAAVAIICCLTFGNGKRVNRNIEDKSARELYGELTQALATADANDLRELEMLATQNNI